MIVDPHTSVRELVGLLIARELDLEVVGGAESGRDGLHLCEKQRADLVIFELALPELCGIEMLRRLRMKRHVVRTLVYSGAPLEMQCRGLLVRPDGFVLKSDPLKTLKEAVQLVADGGVYLSMSLGRLWTAMHSNGACNQALTGREREIVQMVAESRSSKEIAAQLGLSSKTIENHRAHIMQKLNLHDVAALTRFAIREGIV